MSRAQEWPDFQIEAAGAEITEPLSPNGFGYAKFGAFFVRYDWENVWVAPQEGFNKYNDVRPRTVDVGTLTPEDWRSILSAPCPYVWEEA